MRKGIIEISDWFYQNEYDYVWRLFEYFKPTNIEFRHYDNNVWRFYGISEKFRELKDGELIPKYDVIVTNQGNVKYTFEFVEV